MRELELLGLHSDGQHIVFTDEEGARYSVAIDEQLRALVRSDRKLVGALAHASESLSPREIQRLIRAGATPGEIAAAYHVDKGTVSRFEHAVLSERAFIASRAKNAHLHGDPQAPTLGDLVIDRLATRGVSPDSIEWDATRNEDDPWVVQISFALSAKELHASWRFDVKTSNLVALDEEAHWLTETTASAPVQPSPVVTPLPRRELSQTPTTPAKPTATGPSERTLTLLDSLAARRGRRVDIDYENEAELISADESELGDLIDLSDAFSEPDAHPNSEDETAQPATPISPIDDTEELTSDSGLLPGMPPVRDKAGIKRTKKSRKSVPGWDEIIFGTKSD
ncbi:septation protein SepH [Boudabousia marimammalium]|uniref:DUF3071 domain-containing protein n=1 Tax=Boudabousia marimammalium TaxID=156892 RepID=A0A1Q5PQV7_9ACTO|nr:septation protein SepH [Boudabousia marimammalium]OKL49947.1 hypothetical protein BM477_03315 [Boudabousia marimammalium]